MTFDIKEEKKLDRKYLLFRDGDYLGTIETSILLLESAGISTKRMILTSPKAQGGSSSYSVDGYRVCKGDKNSAKRFFQRLEEDAAEELMKRMSRDERRLFHTLRGSCL